MSPEASDQLLNEWFAAVVFVDMPEEDLPVLDPEDDDEPEE